LSEATDAYLTRAGLIELGDRQTLHKSKLILDLLQQYFDALFGEDIDHYEVEGSFGERPYWSVTYVNLYVQRYNISFVIDEVFREWLFKKLDELSEESRLFKLDSIFETTFKDSDVITTATLYWLLYKGKYSTDSNYIIHAVIDNPRPFGHSGRGVTGDWVEDETLRIANFAQHVNTEKANAIKLFANKYATYFRRFWNLDDLIDTANRILSEGGMDKDTLIRLENLLGILNEVKNFYDGLDSPTQEIGDGDAS